MIIAPNASRTRRKSGVTLLEILVAVAVLAVGLAVVVQVFPYGFAAAAKGSASSIAYELASRKIEEIRGDFLFGGLPQGQALTSVDRYRYFGNQYAPNPDPAGGSATRVNTGFSFVQFDTVRSPENMYYYKVNVVPVIDCQRKYLEFCYKDNWTQSNTPVAKSWLGFPTMYRITVIVRGPLQNIDQTSDALWPTFSKSAAEAVLSTMVSNSQYGDALLAVDRACRVRNCEIFTYTNANSTNNGSDGKWHKAPIIPRDTLNQASLPANSGGTISTTYYPSPSSTMASYRGSNRIWIKGFDSGSGLAEPPYPYPENFTVFDTNFLSQEEKDDTGPSLVKIDGGVSTPLRHLVRGYAAAAGDNSDGEICFSDFYNGYHQMPYLCSYGWAGLGENRLGLDNVVIYAFNNNTPSIQVGPTAKNIIIHPPVTKDYQFYNHTNYKQISSSGQGWIAETNKVVTFYAPGQYPNDQATVGAERAKYWQMVLLNDLFGRDSDYATTAGRSDRAIMDNQFDGDVYLRSAKNANGPAVIGYPAGFPGSGSGSSAVNTGTRVRMLVIADYYDN